MAQIVGEELDAIPDTAQRYHKSLMRLAYWHSVGNSINDFVYEAFLDELADAGGHGPYELRLKLLAGNARPAFYVGAIGSRRNDRARRERFIEHFNESHESLQRLRGPVGIYIGSKTPAEIAVSIMAEVLAVKNNVALAANQSVANAKNLRGGATPGMPA